MEGFVSNSSLTALEVPGSLGSFDDRRELMSSVGEGSESESEDEILQRLCEGCFCVVEMLRDFS